MGLFVNSEPQIKLEQYHEQLLSINEAYFGSDMLKDAQRYLSEYRKDLLDNNTLLKSSHPALMKFNSEMEKIFGFHIFELDVVEGNIINAFTMPISYRVGYNHKNKNKCTFNRKTGYKYDPDLKYCCKVSVYTGLICDKLYTDREVMAVILHEIGHNFQEVALDYDGKFGLNFIKRHLSTIAYFNMIIQNMIDAIMKGDAAEAVGTAVGSVIGIGLNSIPIQRAIANTDRFVRDNYRNIYTSLESIMTSYDRLTGMFNDVLQSFTWIASTFMLYNPATLLLNIGIRFVVGLNPLNMVTLGVSYNNEKFSDNFATMYGYGPETASLQSKFSKWSYSNTAEKIANSSPFLSCMSDIVWGALSTTSSIFDPHPYEKVRIADQAELLRKELESSSTNPRMKAQIKKEMIQIELIAKEFDDSHKRSTTTSNYNEIDPKTYTKIYKELIYQLFGEKDFAAKLVDGIDTHQMIDKKFK